MSDQSKAKINPDLQKERDAATIDTEELACLIYNGPEELAKRRKLGKRDNLGVLSRRSSVYNQLSATLLISCSSDVRRRRVTKGYG